MAVTYSCTLTCHKCNAAIRFENERPDWQTYDYRVEMSDECERSAKFVSEHADSSLPMYSEEWPEYEAAGCPQFVFPDRHQAWRGERLVLNIPKPFRYVLCPVCDAQIKEPY